MERDGAGEDTCHKFDLFTHSGCLCGARGRRTLFIQCDVIQKHHMEPSDEERESIVGCLPIRVDRCEKQKSIGADTRLYGVVLALG